MMKNLKYFVLAASVILLLGYSTSTQASELYGLAQEFGNNQIGENATNIEESPQAMFYSIDPDTGIATVIGETGFELCIALDFEPITNRAFAVCERIVEKNGEGPLEETTIENKMEDVGQVLVELDMTTGQGTEIGALGIFLEDSGVTDISFRSDGTLFGIASLTDVEPEDNMKMLEFKEVTLVRIDTNTGQATIVGPTETGASTDSIGFGPQNSLYHATDNILDPGAVNMLDHNTGEGTNIDDLDYPEGFDTENIVNFIASLDFDTSKNKLFGMMISFDPKLEGPTDLVAFDSRMEFAEGSHLITLDPNTGGIELVGFTAPFGNQFGAIAFLNRNLVSEVPTLSEYGLIATAVFFLGASVLFLRRRQAKLEI